MENSETELLSKVRTSAERSWISFSGTTESSFRFFASTALLAKCTTGVIPLIKFFLNDWNEHSRLFVLSSKSFRQGFVLCFVLFCFVFLFIYFNCHFRFRFLRLSSSKSESNEGQFYGELTLACPILFCQNFYCHGNVNVDVQVTIFKCPQISFKKSWKVWPSWLGRF